VSIDDTAKPIESLPVWSREEVRKRHGEWIASKDGERRRRVLLVLEGCVVDAGGYIDDHVSAPSHSTTVASTERSQLISHQPGGEQLLLANCVRPLRRLPSIPFDPLSPDLCRSSSPLIDSGYSSGTPSLSDADRADGAARPLFHRTTSVISSGSSDEGGVSGDSEVALRDATRVFFGGMNNHSVAARERMRSLRVARLAAE
jgi:stearoyl-CoA desaturase (delta-9 desaturase)